MSERRYVVEVTKPVPGDGLSAAAGSVAARLGLDVERVMTLLRGRTGPVTKAVVADKAHSIARVFQEAGVDVAVYDVVATSVAEAEVTAVVPAAAGAEVGDDLDATPQGAEQPGGAGHDPAPGRPEAPVSGDHEVAGAPVRGDYEVAEPEPALPPQLDGWDVDDPWANMDPWRASAYEPPPGNSDDESGRSERSGHGGVLGRTGRSVRGHEDGGLSSPGGRTEQAAAPHEGQTRDEASGAEEEARTRPPAETAATRLMRVLPIERRAAGGRVEQEASGRAEQETPATEVVR